MRDRKWRKNRYPVIATSIYLLFGYSWVLLGDFLLYLFYPRSGIDTIKWEATKGILFVSISALLLWLVLRTLFRRALATTRKLEASYDQSVHSLVTLVERRDAYTAGHSQRVAVYAEDLGRRIGLDKSKLSRLKIAGYLHDIGKIETPDSILVKPGKLTTHEYAIIKRHPETGYKILSHMDYYGDMVDLLLHHHERFDGKGYPAGKGGSELPVESHVMILCDAFDAMTSQRIYRGRYSVEEAMLEIEALAGQQFHPDLIPHAKEVFQLNDASARLLAHPDLDPLALERLSYFFRDPLTGMHDPAFLKLLIDYNVVSTDSVVVQFPAAMRSLLVNSARFQEYPSADYEKSLTILVPRGKDLVLAFTDAIYGESFIEEWKRRWPSSSLPFQRLNMDTLRRPDMFIQGQVSLNSTGSSDEAPSSRSLQMKIDYTSSA